jgi:hypothetical protein
MQPTQMFANEQQPSIIPLALEGSYGGRMILYCRDQNKSAYPPILTIYCLNFGLIIAGGIMWGLCNNPVTHGDLNIKITGQILTGLGLSLLGIETIMAIAFICCVIKPMISQTL